MLAQGLCSAAPTPKFCGSGTVTVLKPHEILNATGYLQIEGPV